MNVAILESTMPPAEMQAPMLLVVDGAAGLAGRLRDSLEHGGYALTTCRDSEAVGAILALAGVDLVMLEAGPAGYELCGELRATEVGRQIPILLVSPAALDEQVVTQGLLCGADDVVTIDGRMTELQARIRVQLRNKRDRDRLRRLRAERDSYRLEAAIDPLTGVANRRTFDARIADACRQKDACAVIFVDVDHFKRINDELGHDVGDRVLQAIARCMDGTCRAEDVCARHGGEEFAILAKGLDDSGAAELGERIRSAVASSAMATLPEGAVTVSVGVAVRHAGEDPAALCRRADEALYQAKRGGRNRVVLGRAAASASGGVETRLLARLATGRGSLPVLPEAAQEALQLAEDPRTDMGRIARLVDGDPAIAARFVALAGSAVYSGRVRPTSTKGALVRIGLHAARDLLLQVVYERSSDLPMFRAEVAACFERSVKVAHACRQIAGAVRPGFDLAYLCGLLHDIGEARIYRVLSQLPDAHSIPPEAISVLVQKHHARAGADVARAWSLPPDIVQACEEHHAPPARAAFAGRLVMAGAALVRLAAAEAPDDAADLAMIVDLGVSPDAVAALVEALRALDAPEPPQG